MTSSCSFHPGVYLLWYKGHETCWAADSPGLLGREPGAFLTLRHRASLALPMTIYQLITCSTDICTSSTDIICSQCLDAGPVWRQECTLLPQRVSLQWDEQHAHGMYLCKYAFEAQQVDTKGRERVLCSEAWIITCSLQIAPQTNPSPVLTGSAYMKSLRYPQWICLPTHLSWAFKVPQAWQITEPSFSGNTWKPGRVSREGQMVPGTFMWSAKASTIASRSLLV